MNSATCCARSVRGVLAMRPEPERLPCRGCTRDCANYAHCDGRPWRYRSSGERLSGAGVGSSAAPAVAGNSAGKSA